LSGNGAVGVSFGSDGRGVGGAIFKSTGRSIRSAFESAPRPTVVPSGKGVLRFSSGNGAVGVRRNRFAEIVKALKSLKSERSTAGGGTLDVEK